MKRYKIKTKFIFEGTFEVLADSKKDAIRTVNEDCGLSIGEVHTTNDYQVKDWNFDMTPEKANL